MFDFDLQAAAERCRHQVRPGAVGDGACYVLRAAVSLPLSTWTHSLISDFGAVWVCSIFELSGFAIRNNFKHYKQKQRHLKHKQHQQEQVRSEA